MLVLYGLTHRIGYIAVVCNACKGPLAAVTSWRERVASKEPPGTAQAVSRASVVEQVEDGVVISVTVDVHELPRYTHAPNQTKPHVTLSRLIR
jgi:hypothetical protein